MHQARQQIAPGIEAGPDLVSGTPVLQGTRIPIWAVVRALVDLGSIEEVARSYEVEPEQIKQALSYTADVLEDIRVGVLT
ncbi:MAG TPA: DUF433 domain-containing protein [Candidatus Fraserbacteria bacterium]|nr:DUF433 domain-containing protein [Candidatus Fraserbacteria bacterium]